MDESDNIEIDRRVKALSDHLLKANLVMVTAESCTGGGIAQAITALAGSSRWFDSGFVTYSNEAKQSMLDVPAVFFEPDGPGAVSEETVRAMVTGALRKSGADLAVAVSGVAGPGGGSVSNPLVPSGLPGSWALTPGPVISYSAVTGKPFVKRPYWKRCRACWPTSLPNSKGIPVSANILVVYTVKYCFNLYCLFIQCYTGSRRLHCSSDPRP